MEQEKCAELFEKSLFSHVEMCYSVALALTGSPEDACSLARETLEGAWRHRAATGTVAGMKMMLLTALRSGFLKDYPRAVRPGEQGDACGDVVACAFQDVAWNAGKTPRVVRPRLGDIKPHFPGTGVRGQS